MSQSNGNGNLSSRAMLVNFSARKWSARKFDKQVTQEVATAHNTSERAGQYTKNLLGDKEIKSYKTLCQSENRARTLHYEQTLPWNDEGWRILPSANYLDYCAKLKTEKNLWEKDVQGFLTEYPQLVTDARRALNSLWKAEDYPALEKLEETFSFETKVRPLPDEQDFRVQLGDADVDEIRQQITSDTNTAVASAMSDLYSRLLDVVTKMRSKLTDKEAIFRDSLVQNVRDVCAVIPKLNLTGDVKLEQLAQTIETELTLFDAEDLRTNKKARELTALKASTMENTLAAILGR